MKLFKITTKTTAVALSAVMMFSSVCAVAEDAVKVYVDGR